MRNFPFALLLILLVGCQYDPHSNVYTTNEPKTEDIVGTYILDRFDLPNGVATSNIEVEVDLHADGTFNATNVPPWKLNEPDKNFFASLVSGKGTWRKSVLGTLDPGHKSIWGIYLDTPDNRILPADLTGEKAPYGLIFTLGDPDSGNAVLLRRKQ